MKGDGALTICAVDDLIFATRIRTTAADLGVDVLTIRCRTDVRESDADRARLVIVDLELSADDAVALIGHLRQRHPHLPIIAYGPHVDTAVAAAARNAGATRVLPRSRFSATLAELLSGPPAATQD